MESQKTSDKGISEQLKVTSKMPSSSRDNGNSVLAFSAGLAIAAAVTYQVTKRREQRRQQQIIYRQYEREKVIKEKTAEFRRQAQEPPAGTLLGDVVLDKVFLWMCEDLRKRFPMANVANTMKRKAHSGAARSPLLRQQTTISDTDGDDEKGFYSSHVTEYNKLITDHECILAGIVRKPNGPTNTVAYMRAGPRRMLHFDPEKVNAASKYRLELFFQSVSRRLRCTHSLV